MSSFTSGFFLGFSLILAIGSQNAFVLRAGLRREHVLSLVLTCALSDAILVMVGVAGFGAVIEAFPNIIVAFRYFGAAFLCAYGVRSFYSAYRGNDGLVASGQSMSWAAAITTCLVFTWLNPHVYLDTVILLGSASHQYADPWVFGFGAVTASFTFFFALGFGARLLSGFFANPTSWRVLDVVIGLTMWTIAFELVRNG